MASVATITEKPKQAPKSQPSIGEEWWDGQKWLVWTGKNWGKAHTYWDDRKAELKKQVEGFEDKLVRCRQCEENRPAYYAPGQHCAPKQAKLLDGLCFGCYAERRHLRGQYKPQSAPSPTMLPEIQKKYKKRAEAVTLVHIMGLSHKQAGMTLGISRQAVDERLKTLPFPLTYRKGMAGAIEAARAVDPNSFSDWPDKDRIRLRRRRIPAPHDVVYARNTGRCPCCGSRVEMDNCGCILCHQCRFSV